ncbi:MAG: 4-(cytidine 5'-diphospho)-2-C-methyl-D-erythritol kinase [Tissierellales bacterium]|nr:4-(cytidine 5'-diphospho)-2-C-methyl-D-erythritol kinase [Tissierellales bacterium]MBN2828642.1 4-(cytidine 5'-diphospho)-2-C-methyl-D-erythritol kinase [Tissierellales bacterium]
MKKIGIGLYSHAKINLFFNIVSKRRDGYHQIQSIMQTVDISDELFIKYSEKGINITCDNPSIPLGSANIAYKAAEVMMNRYHINQGIEIHIKKNIPQGAGLAGGSGNAAAVILGIDRMFHLELSREELIDIGKRIGADVPYCILGGTCLAEGIGEELKPIRPFRWEHILIVKPDFSISTEALYKQVLPDMYERYDIRAALNDFSCSEMTGLLNTSKSVLEDLAVGLFPEIGDIKRRMMSFGAVHAIMTGSGSAVIGFFQNYDQMYQCGEYFKTYYRDVFQTNTVEEGVTYG